MIIGDDFEISIILKKNLWDSASFDLVVTVLYILTLYWVTHSPRAFYDSGKFTLAVWIFFLYCSPKRNRKASRFQSTVVYFDLSPCPSGTVRPTVTITRVSLRETSDISVGSAVRHATLFQHICSCTFGGKSYFKTNTFLIFGERVCFPNALHVTVTASRKINLDTNRYFFTIIKIPYAQRLKLCPF